MHSGYSGELPESDPPIEFPIQVIWQAILAGDDPGSTNWEVLEYLYSRVFRCLGECPPDIGLAEHFTAKALLLISGRLVL